MKNIDIEKIEERYTIFENGSVWSKKHNRLLKTKEGKKGYVLITFFIDKKPIRLALHRVIATKFLPKIDNKLHVNHKDGNPSNNDVSNLEWCNHSENIKHAYDNGLCGKLEKIIFNESIIFNSITEASKYTKLSMNSIIHRLKGRTSNEKEFRFQYYNQKIK
jgi:hypothetical protein